MKKCFFSEKGPKAIGPYATAVSAGGTVYLSGVIPVDPASGAIQGETAKEQAVQVFENMRVILSEMNLSMANVLKTTVFLTDLAQFGAVNEVYARYFGPDYPARSCVQISALPKGAQIEVEAIVSEN